MHFQHATDAFTLKNGVKIPCIGFGTWQSADGPTAENAVREAIEALKSSKAPTNYFTPNILRKSWSRLVVSVVHLDALAFPVAAT